MLPCQLNIAVDGPAGAGKSSVARAVAQALGLLYLDTGAMYRAVTWKALQEGVLLEDEQLLGGLARQTLFSWEQIDGGRRLVMDGRPLPEAIRQDEVTSAVSLVASYESVRSHLRFEQRRLCAEPGVIMDGRDIGTVVMPDADLKVFLTASSKERARRRLLQLGRDLSEIDAMAEEIERRDAFDSTRDHSPLMKAADAIEINTTDLDLNGVVELIVNKAEGICQSRGKVK